METNHAIESSQPTTPRENRGPLKIAYNITESRGKSYWTRIGRAYVNKDGSINVFLESFPVTGQLQIRDYEPYEDRRGGEGGNGPSVARSRPQSSSNNGPLTELPF